jgi:sugar lactone lactonase YvrE
MKLAFAFALLAVRALCAQSFVISTIAGGGGESARALTATIGAPKAIATDANGNVFLIAEAVVFKLDSGGILTRIAGIGGSGFSGDGGPARAAHLDNPTALAADRAGTLYIAERGGRVRKVTPGGTISTFAGNGICNGGCYTNGAGDGGPATSVQLFYPYQLAVHPNGELYIGEWNTSRVRKVSADGIIKTVVGTGKYGYSGDGGPATSAQIGAPWGLAFDDAGNLFISDAIPGDDVDPTLTHVRKVSPDGVITTVAGSGPVGYSGDGGPAVSAQLSQPGPLAADSRGNLYIADGGRVRRISTEGIITTITGDGRFGYSGDGGPATQAEVSLSSYGQGLALAANDAGEIFIADTGNNRVRKVSEDGKINTVAGNGMGCCFSGDGGLATAAQLYIPAGVAVDRNGTVYVADTFNNRVRTIDYAGVITTVAGTGVPFPASGDGGPAVNARIAWPTGLKLDGSGNLYIADAGNMRVRKVSPEGIIQTVAGDGFPGYRGDGGPAAAAELSWPKDIAFDGSGNMYIADTANHVIRKVTTDGVIATFAGTGGDLSGAGGYSGDGGLAASARMNQPSGLAVDSAGNVYVSDTENFRVRKVTPAGVITTIAGNGSRGYSGDGGLATQAQLTSPTGLAFDTVGNLYIGDGASVRMISADGIISTVAGNGLVGYAGDGGPASSAQTGAWGLAFDSQRRLYVADPWNNAVRLLTPVRSQAQ